MACVDDFAKYDKGLPGGLQGGIEKSTGSGSGGGYAMDMSDRFKKNLPNKACMPSIDSGLEGADRSMAGDGSTTWKKASSFKV